MSKEEIDVSIWGQMLFHIVTTEDCIPPHWESIREEAKPLVEKLLALNEKMSDGGYKIIGLVKKTKSGKKKKTISSHEKADLARIHDLEIEASKLEEKDWVWLVNDYDCPTEDVWGDTAEEVYEVTKKGVYIDRGRAGIYLIDKKDKVFKKPNNWTDEMDQEEYWVKRYEELEEGN